MIERVRGIDPHKSLWTICVLNRAGEEARFEGACREFREYVGGLGPSDAVVLEASNGSFWWADQIEAKGRRASWWIRGTWRRRCGCTSSRGSSGSRRCTSPRV